MLIIMSAFPLTRLIAIARPLFSTVIMKSKTETMTPAENAPTSQACIVGQRGRWNVKGPSSLTVRIGTQMRYQMFDTFISEFKPSEMGTILDVGVTDEDESVSESCNYFEARYPYKYRVTGLGIEDASHLERLYPGFRFVRGSALHLPFANGSFDYVHSSAVLEHVGSEQNQARMVAECLRVGRKGVFLTTPNRWFPIEVHTVIPLLHWLPKGLHRKLMRGAGLTFWAEESNLNLMSRRQILAAAAAIPNWKVRVTCTRLFGWPSNLIFVAHASQD